MRELEVTRLRREETMRPSRGNQSWHIDTMSLQLADSPFLLLVVATDCFAREIVSWTPDRRARAARRRT